MELEAGTPDGDRFEVLGVLVEDYEKKNYPIDPPIGIEAIAFQVEQMGLGHKALEKMIGSRARVSEILAGEHPLTLPMMRRLNEGLGIPFDTLARQSFNTETAKRARRKNPNVQIEVVDPTRRTSKRRPLSGRAKP